MSKLWNEKKIVSWRQWNKVKWLICDFLQNGRVDGAKILDLNGMKMIKPLSLVIAPSFKIGLDWTENLAREVL